MGGRIALEVGLTRPERVGGLALLCPAVAFVKRDWHWVVRFARPELGMLPHSLGRERIERTFWALFADRDLVDPAVADVVVDEFERIYRSPGARLAFMANARAIYLERAYGRGGFYERLSALEPPALFVWSSHDRLIPEALPLRTSSARCRRPSRSCSTAPATCRRSSGRSAPTACCRGSSRGWTRSARPPIVDKAA